MLIQPGPPALEPGLRPGGVVIHVYATTDPPTLVTEQLLGPGDDIELAAHAGAGMVEKLAPGDVCLVAYDGDTGERMTRWATTRPPW